MDNQNRGGNYVSVPRSEFPNRLSVFVGVMILIFAIILGKLVFLQVINAEEYHKMAMGQWVRDTRLNAKRGLIFDREGKKLAVNLGMYSVWIRPKDIEDVNKTADTLQKILLLDREYIMSCLTHKGNSKILKRWIPKETADLLFDIKKAEEIEERKLLYGIDIIEDIKRYYPYGTVGSQIMGFTNVDNVGISGLEKLYNTEMTGVRGRTVYTKARYFDELPFGNSKLTEPEDGYSVVLTIDEEIQEKVEKEAYKALVKTKANFVTVVAMNPKTGEILAMTTKPDYNPNERMDLLYSLDKPWELMGEQELEQVKKMPAEEKNKRVYERYRNRTITDMYEPGSVFKAVTGAVAVEENIVGDPFNDYKYFCDGRVTQVPGNLKCWYYPRTHGAETFANALQNSCNDALVQMALELKQDTLLKYYKAFGFGEKTGIELVGESKGILPSDPSTIKDIELATMCYGQGKIVVTPLQLITAVSTIVNGGNLMEPMIVDKLVDVEGNVISENEPKVRRRVVSEETSSIMRRVLETVVTKGGGKAAKIPGYRIGGKTGTAQKVVDGKYADGKYVSSFMGIAPIEDPEILVLTVVDEPRTGRYGSKMALPTSREVLRFALPYLKKNPKYTAEEKKWIEEQVEVPNFVGKKVRDIQAIADKNNVIVEFDRVMIKEEDEALEQYPSAGTKVNKLERVDIILK
jgi:stage V sporulation protein D (sporulation-specific penicillin-binding protein)